MRLYHVSDVEGVERFEPRPPPPTNPGAPREPAVWAVGERLLHNYLVPRDCPRVTYYARETTTEEDRARFLLGTSATYVVAIERAWLDRMRNQTLFLYEMPSAPFNDPFDDGAEHYVAHETIVPLGVTVVSDLVGAMTARDVEFRVMPSLWKLRDAVMASSIQFSCIRMRNAGPR